MRNKIEYNNMTIEDCLTAVAESNKDYNANGLGNTINQYKKSELDIKYDHHIKILLSYKSILALILKYSIVELKDYDIETIATFIEGNVEIGSQEVLPHSKETIDGNTQESSNISEGNIRFDLKFHLVLPEDEDQEYREVIVNLESQNQFNTNYDIAKRGIYYCSRLLSEQITNLNDSKVYNDLKKVYSIWLFTNPPKKYANTISEFKMTKKNRYRKFTKDVDYDLMSMIFICLGDFTNNPMIETMEKLLSRKYSIDAMKSSLEKVGVPIKQEVLKEVDNMCNLSQGIREEGRLEGRLEGKIEASIDIYRKKLHMSDDDILKEIISEYNLPKNEVLKYLKKDTLN